MQRPVVTILILVSVFFSLPVTLVNAGARFSTTEFQLPQNEEWVSDLVPIDFDGDGDLDFIVLQLIWPFPEINTDAKAIIARNLGGGRFEAVTDSWANSIGFVGPGDWDINDFNMDGRPDFVVADGGIDVLPSLGGQSRIILRTAQGTLTDETSSRFPQVNIFTHSITSGDINNDGSPDVYLGNIWGVNKEGPWFNINNGAGFFAKDKTRIPTAMSDISIQKFNACNLADFDNDGDLDLILGRDGDVLTKDSSVNFNKDVLLLNDGNGFFSPVPDSSMPDRAGVKENSVVNIRSGDFNNDGKKDILISTTFKYQTTQLQLLINNGNNTFIDKSNNIPQSWPSNAWIRKTIPADFNNDGNLDFLAVGNGSAPTKLYYNKGNAIFEDVTASAGIPEIIDTGWAVGDFTGDGWLDIIVVNHDESVSLLTNMQGVKFPTSILLLLNNN